MDMKNNVGLVNLPMYHPHHSQKNAVDVYDLKKVVYAYCCGVAEVDNPKFNEDAIIPKFLPVWQAFKKNGFNFYTFMKDKVYEQIEDEELRVEILMEACFPILKLPVAKFMIDWLNGYLDFFKRDSLDITDTEVLRRLFFCSKDKDIWKIMASGVGDIESLYRWYMGRPDPAIEEEQGIPCYYEKDVDKAVQFLDYLLDDSTNATDAVREETIRLKEYAKEIVMLTKKMEELAQRGEQHDIMDALRLLTVAYIDMCGISKGCRTVVLCAAGEWQERLAWMDLPLSEKARKNGLIDLMPYITSDYNPEIYDRYDIACMSREELLSCCEQIVKEKDFDEPTTEVLCWGILKILEEEERQSQEIEAMAQDGTVIRSDYYSQSCGRTFVAITSPYHFSASKDELVRNLDELLVEAYNDYQRLHKMENQVRELYPRYQAELAKCKDAGEWKKLCVFTDVYSAIISNSIIVPLSMAKLFNEWWGLDFYKFNYKKECIHNEEQKE